LKAEQGCAGCIIDDIAGAVRLMGVDEAKQLEVINACMGYLGKSFNFNELPSTFITQVHRIAKEKTGQRIPFSELRKNCNDVGLTLSRKLEVELSKQKDCLARFETLIKWVIASNHLDFRTVGTGYDVPISVIEQHVLTKVKEPLKINDIAEFYKMMRHPAATLKAQDSNQSATQPTATSAVKTAAITSSPTPAITTAPTAAPTASLTAATAAKKPSLLFIHDNVGEIAFDKLLIKEFKNSGWFVTSALRGGPITSDATLEDGAYVGINETADLVICAGPDTLGISWEEKSPELDYALTHSDLIVSKGQANFYLFSDYQKVIKKPVMCLLTTKCPYVSSYFKETSLISVAKLLNE
jgi:uncharacterized protein with ATP-grasp and redox domains